MLWVLHTHTQGVARRYDLTKPHWGAVEGGTVPEGYYKTQVGG